MGSPAIDAALAANSTPTDLLGAPRVDDPRVPNQGTALPDGSFADLGAYEFAEAAHVNVDLVVDNVTAPAGATAGDTVEIQWVIRNLGSDSAVGPWHDAVYVTDVASGRRMLVGEVLSGGGAPLAGGAKTVSSATFRVPGGVGANLHWEIVANSRGDVFEGINGSNNGRVAEAPLALDIPELVVGGAVREAFFEDRALEQWYRFRVPAGIEVRLALEAADPGAATEILVSVGELPTPESFGFRQREWASAISTCLVAPTQDRTYYVIARARALPNGRTPFRLSAAAVGFGIESVSTPRVGNTGDATVGILGSQLSDRAVTFELVAANGERRPAHTRSARVPGKVFATFDLRAFPPGPADLVATWQGAQSRLSGAVNVIDGGRPEFYAYVTGPSVVRLGRTATLYLTWGNRGLADVPVPWLTVSSQGAQAFSIFQSTLNWADSVVFLGFNDQTLLPTIGPGQEMKIAITVKPSTSARVPVELRVLAGDRAAAETTPISWSNLVRPDGVLPADWDAHVASLKGRFGSNLGEFYRYLMSELSDFVESPLRHEYLANANGQWLIGPEIGEASEPKPIIDVEPLIAANPHPPLLGVRKNAAPAGEKKADGIRKTYFVIIADEDYRGTNALATTNILSGVDKDFRDMVDFAMKDARAGSDQVRMVYDSGTRMDDTITYRKITDAITGLKGKLDGDDNLVVYYAGHGGRRANGEGYLALNGDYLAPSELAAAVDAVGAKNTFFLNDSCHSEAFNKAVAPTNTTFVGLAATGENTHSWGNNRSGGDFTSEFKKNYRNCNGVGASFVYTKNNVAAQHASNANAVDRQNPVLTNPNNVNLGPKVFNDASGMAQQIRDDIKAGRARDPAWTEFVLSQLGSFDPNDKTGPTGYGDAHFVPGGQIFPYTILFENKPTASAPAQGVLVLDPLDQNLDWASLELQTIGFNGVVLQVPPGRQQFTATTSVSTDPNPVSVSASFDSIAGVIRWEIGSFDPATGRLPENPLAGFLPPNDTNHSGEGFVSFFIKPKTGLTDGTIITNQATIIFDPLYQANPAILTPTVFNTIDSTAPRSAVTPLAETASTPFRVDWSGTDAAGGSGIAGYDVLVSRDSGPFEVWLAATTATTTLFLGESGHQYAFYTIAIDGAGNREPAPEKPDASTLATAGLRIAGASIDGASLVLNFEGLSPRSRYVIETTVAVPGGPWSSALEFEASGVTERKSIVRTGDTLFVRLRTL